MKAVRDAVPIDSVVSEYLQLRNAGGGNLKGLCPFHDEKSPSFHVSPSKGFYHCFGCQEGGDTLDFVMKVDHLSFSESVERLAARAGITLRYEEGGYGRASQQGERTRLVEAHRIAARFYAEQLDGPEAEIGRRFLADRGFDQEAARHFGIGYSPAGWDHLVRYLRGRAGLHRQGAHALRPRPGGAQRPSHRPLPRPSDVADPRHHRRRRRLRRPQAARGRPGAEIPQHAGDPPLPQVAGALRHRPGQAGDRQGQPRRRRGGLHRRHGLPPGGRDHGHRHLRHRLRR